MNYLKKSLERTLKQILCAEQCPEASISKVTSERPELGEIEGKLLPLQPVY